MSLQFFVTQVINTQIYSLSSGFYQMRTTCIVRTMIDIKINILSSSPCLSLHI